MIKTMEFRDHAEVFQPVEMEDTLIKLNEELKEYPKDFIRRVNARVLELKFHKHNAYSLIDACIKEGDIYVVNLHGIVYVAGTMIDSNELLTFGEFQYPSIRITQVWKN